MGASTSTCISGHCSKDNSVEFSDVLSTTREDDTFHVYTADTKSSALAADLPSTPQRDHISTPDSHSKQSVLSEISPTKDRSSPSRHNSTIHELQLYSDSLDEFVGTWNELHDIIKNGSVQELSAYSALKRMDLPMIWFKDKHRTPLHLAVLYDRLDMVEYLLDQGLNINARDDDGVAAVGLAYETSASSEIINLLLSTKASQFANSPYSPYALSVASTVRSAQLRKQSAQYGSTTAAEHTDHIDRLDVASVRSDPPSVDSRTPQSRTYSMDTPRERRLTNTPLAQYKQNWTPTETFLSRVTDTLDQLGRRQRSNSLPANSPLFDNITVRARSPTDPPARTQSQENSFISATTKVCPPIEISAPLLIQPEALLQDADFTPGEDSSPRSSLTQASAYESSTGSVDGAGKPPRDPKKPRKPIGTRLRKAAGRAMSMIIPTSSSTSSARGMPPRVPLPSTTATRPLSTTLMSGITTASAHDDTADEDQQMDQEVHKEAGVVVVKQKEEQEEKQVEDDDMSDVLNLHTLYAQQEESGVKV